MDEEINAELERIQQQITLNLQEIDKNFATCNQLVASKIIPEMERFAKATMDIWESSKAWMYFFKTVEETFNQYNTTSTNRPPFSPQERNKTNPEWELTQETNAKEGMSSSSSIELYRSNRRAPSVSTMTTNQIMEGTSYNKNNDSNNRSTPNSVNSQGALVDEYGNQIVSPPRTRQFTPLVTNTPLREAVSILTDYDIQRTRDDLTESSEEEPRPTIRKEEDIFDPLDMDKDDPATRERFYNFFNGRQKRLRNMKEGEELPRIRKMAKSPSRRYDHTPRSFQSSMENLVSTPTAERVMLNREMDLRQRKSLSSVNNEEDDEEEEVGAYQFSDPWR
ncbi:hypothetical protein RMATCC62417_01166 [Rhizopus microsporus]|nr:hypothetical protein RMATCC62417_01166 [Rhizopus microsporus]